jgi:hypothetical protein
VAANPGLFLSCRNECRKRENITTLAVILIDAAKPDCDRS